MATLNMSITIPDAQLSRVQVALKDYFGDANMTNAAAVEALRQEVIARIKELVRRKEIAAAHVAADNADYSVGAT